ncbi:MAG: S-layer homology domain-containing protein, partial [Oscillospiraceae bacterium]|nr:S-layer homology domain-containing protein [Oscillospiraceae bacterium]
AVGQSLSIPLSVAEDSSPVFEPVANASTSARSSITIPIKVESPVGKDITLIGTTLPRGMTLNAEQMTVTWKPDDSQVGENHVAITADDGTLSSTLHFMVTVYGATTGAAKKEENEGSEGSESATGGGGGGGGGDTAAPEDTNDTDETDDAESGENSPDASGETEYLRFTDLGNYAWAAESINSLADDGIIKGTTENTYSPALNITRADFALLLVRAFNLESESTENFDDVDASDYFASELAIARNTGIISGIGDNKYAPRNTITRQDMMVIVYRALENLGVELATGEVDYPDFDKVAPYAQDAVKALVTSAFVNGKNNMIAPTDYTTRAEVAVLLKRILEYTKQ